MIQFGKTIKRLRVKNGLSQQELAEMAGLTRSFLSLLENDLRTPSITAVRNISESLSVPEEVFIWECFELPHDLPQNDKKICEMAKLIVRDYLEAKHADPTACDAESR
ncbi:HTH-type transcriptional regulator SinR [Symmachiella dynata]|uniref:helix-turn-helix domain-containing protein n=1 Tax=Symmachiella dynata TaxID=2527995 RepID=UPI00118C9005|nr:helix-turn-helix transcriptional regulator [Symmachiella dynata]QDT51893.1 HTH-type transcriptional regulator SinR [Symmachiella dynata]